MLTAVSSETIAGLLCLLGLLIILPAGLVAGYRMAAIFDKPRRQP